MFSSGAENTPYTGLPPCYYASPLHLFNIDDENNENGGAGGSPPSSALLQPLLLDHSCQQQQHLGFRSKEDFSFIPPQMARAATAPGDHDKAGHNSGISSLSVPLSSYFFQSLTEEANYSQRNGLLHHYQLQDEYHFAPGPACGEGEDDFIELGQAAFLPQFSPPLSASEAATTPPVPTLPTFGSQAATPHNRRMIFPYTYKKGKGGSSGNSDPCSSSSSGRASNGGGAHSSTSAKDEPQLLYRFFEFHCTNCEQSWLSPLFRAKNGCFCRICHHFIMPRGIRHSFTPYLGKETCYGKYTCHLCKRGWSSYKSLSNCPDQCFQCGTLVYPYYQIAHSVLTQKMSKNEHEFNLSGSDGAPSSSSSSSPAKSAFLKSLFTHHTQNQSSSSSSSPTGGRQNNARINSNLAGIGGLEQDMRRKSLFGLPRKITSISTLPISPQSGNRAPVMAENLLVGGAAAAVIGGNSGIKTNNKKRLHCPNTNNNIPLSIIRKKSQLKNCYSEPIIYNS